ncbi:hypothetical protein GcM3_185046 [Golovinomyces cichoracearum]|uniref:Uncharacterized protein n=1 Tax=Golovinomyces cichoracearum TaxID=62708 RepID=A0A420HKI8_9PEZI|nr:hypothetical protein GcM3_185046 [Golovinomyces cichoracearum]
MHGTPCYCSPNSSDFIISAPTISNKIHFVITIFSISILLDHPIEIYEIDELSGPCRAYFLDTNLSSPVVITEIEESKQFLLQLAPDQTTQSFFKIPSRRRQELLKLKTALAHLKIDTDLQQNIKSLQPREYPSFVRDLATHTETHGNEYDFAHRIAQEFEQI